MLKPPETNRATTDRVRYLDGWRACAILAVLFGHFVTTKGINLGRFGVELFFVLSGYLITRIILDYRRMQPTIQRAAAQFYWRRFLRLAPPLVFAICAAAHFGVANMQNDWWIHALYLSNFQIALTGE